MKRVIVIALGLAAAAGAWAGLGSVISSFSYSSPIGGTAYGLHVENGYVYFVCDNGLGGGSRLCCTAKYTVAGSYVGSGPLDLHPLLQAYGPYACEASHLGNGYIYVTDVETGAYGGGVYDLTTGLRVGGPQLYNYTYFDIAWDGQYYYAYDGYYPGVFHRTTVGGAESSFAVPGFPMSNAAGLACANAVAGVNGRYLVVSPIYTASNGCYINLETNSVTGTFALPFSGPATYAPGYPSSYGGALWILGRRTINDRTCYQIDLGNSNLATIAPASLGRIRAVYR